jgi:hypothetical protein
MTHSSFLAATLAYFAFASLAQAQLAGQPNMPQIDPKLCDQLAQIPNSPMTVEACKSLMNMAQPDPNANLPGDSALSCDQMFAEMQSTPMKGVSNAQAARTEALIEESRTLDARMGAQTQAAIAPETAVLSAAATAGGLLPNAVNSAATYGAMASINAKTGAAAQANLKERRRLSNETASAIDLHLNNNPRVAHLAKLAAAKGCDIQKFNAP